MSYELFVSGKPKGQVASMGGMSDLTQKYGDRQNELGAFLRRGYSKVPQQLAQVIREMLVDETDVPIRDTLRTLLVKLPVHGIVSISSE